MQGYPEEWIRAYKKDTEFVAGPAGWCMHLSNMAYDMHRRRVISSDQLGDMLELADGGREWGLQEREEAWDLGIFGDFPDLDQTGRVRFDGEKAWIVR